MSVFVQGPDSNPAADPIADSYSTAVNRYEKLPVLLGGF